MLSDPPANVTFTSGRSTPSYRVRVLTEIAARYHELVDPLSKAGIPGDGDTAGLLQMPRTYTDTVREFERLCRLMRDDRTSPLIILASGEKVSVRQLKWHLTEYHLNAQTVIRHRPVEKLRGRHRVRLMNHDGTPATKPEIATMRNPQARADLANAAIRWMCDRWGLKTEPMLPGELQAAA